MSSRTQRKTITAIVAGGCAVAMVGPAASATVLVYDPFATTAAATAAATSGLYSTSNTVASNSSQNNKVVGGSIVGFGSGAAQLWESNTTAYVANATPLTHPNVAVQVGGALNIVSTSTAQRYLFRDTTAAFDNTGATTETWYVSGLMSGATGSTNNRVAYFGIGAFIDGSTDNASTFNAASKLTIGISNAALVVNTPGGTSATIASSYTADQTYFFLAKIVKNISGVGSNDKVLVWLNPTSHTELAENTATASILGANAIPDTFGPASLLFNVTNFGSGTFKFDEPRVTTTWAEAVPEPGSALTLGSMALFACASRPRRPRSV